MLEFNIRGIKGITETRVIKEPTNIYNEEL